jgi:hypothetical protein
MLFNVPANAVNRVLVAEAFHGEIPFTLSSKLTAAIQDGDKKVNCQIFFKNFISRFKPKTEIHPWHGGAVYLVVSSLLAE